MQSRKDRIRDAVREINDDKDQERALEYVAVFSKRPE
jgi:hypothetical protein